MFYHKICWFGFFRSKELLVIAYKSDTYTCFLFQQILLQQLEAALVRTYNKCILGFPSDNL